MRLERGNLVEANVVGENRKGWRLEPTDCRVFEEEVLDWEPVELYQSESEGTIALEPGGNARQVPMQTESQQTSTWEGYVTSLTEWERDLLGDQPSEEGEVNRLIQVLGDSAARVLVVSDGGCKEKIGSFGWVMAVDGERLWQCSGRVRGHDLNSYRAEATGMLSWLKFVQEFTRFHRVTTRCKILPYCDNLSLVEEVQYENMLGNMKDALKPEFDLLIAILRTRQELQL
jgi:hypothetical protein